MSPASFYVYRVNLAPWPVTLLAPGQMSVWRISLLADLAIGS
jgi:hypothetical protein